MEKIFMVNGMSCKHCQAMVENELNSVKNVQSAIVNLEDNSVRVTMDDSLSIDVIKDAIESVGFEFAGEK